LETIENVGGIGAPVTCTGLLFILISNFCSLFLFLPSFSLSLARENEMTAGRFFLFAAGATLFLNELSMEI